MNKKFSTLMASALLATSVGAFATPGFFTTDTPASFTAADEEILQEKYYMLGVGGTTNVVTVDAQTDGTLVLKSVAHAGLSSLAEVDSALWQVTTDFSGSGSVLRFYLTNKATGVSFSFDTKNAVDGNNGAPTMSAAATQTGGVLTAWDWYASRYYAAGGLNRAADFRMGFRNAGNDSVLYVAQGTGGILFAAKESVKNTAAINTNAVDLQIMTPGSWILSAVDLNTKGDDVKYMQLSFSEDIKENPFADKYQAQVMYLAPISTTDPYGVQVNRANANAGYTGDIDYLFLNKLNEDGELTTDYLRLDTAYYESTGATFKMYNKLTTSSAIIKKNADGTPVVANNHNVIDTLGYNLPDDAFRFKFTKNLLTDSIKVESFSQFVELANGVTPKNQKVGSNAVTYWTMLNSDAAVVSVTSNRASGVATGVQNNTGTLNNVLSHCTLVDENKNVVTFYSDDIATRRPVENYVNLWAHFGTDDDLDSYDDGLYKIQNVKTGEFYGVQIYDMDSTANFTVVDLDEMNLDHMPAFQWVVIKKDHSDARADKSPLAVTNREFADDNDFVWQLRKGTKEGETFMWNGIEIKFVKVADDARKSATVGYKELSKEEVEVNRYTFNYLHPYTLDKFVAVHEDDSLMDVLGETATRFTIEATDAADYGYKVAGSPAATYIKDLAQLKRRSYDIYVGERTVYINKENQLVMTDGSYTGDKPTTFYFKENNQIVKNEENVCYYALINIDGDHVKAGVVDNDLKALMRAQVMDETRTSVFAVEKDDAPLYRRFNNSNLGESITDGPDSLRFYENARHEYLMDENNPNWQVEGMSYVGMWTADKATGLAFRIDTAVIKRDNGDVKPQYLLSVAHNDFEGIPGSACTEDGPHFDFNGEPTDADHCIHAHMAVPGFQRGKYVVSFADSAAIDKDVPYTDIKNGYTRVGFVEAIRVADTLWVLPEKFQALANEDINFDELNAYNKALTDAGYKGIKNLLTGEQHKNYTWSFRYVTPENAGNVTEEGEANQFLIESNNYDGVKIAPEKAAWLKIQNGCVVLTDKSAEFSYAKTGGDGALIFNVENIADDELATDNEEISTSEVKVIAGNGQITIAGAAGKQVVVSNILGQVVANTVLTSDNATIAAPQGVVVVAVEGEEAVKAIVK